MSIENSQSSPIKEDQQGEEEEKESKKDDFSQSQLEKIDSCKQEDDDREDKILGLGESEVAEDDEGFKTPTSSDHKIPVMSECPPAPKKIRPESSRKRKASPPRTRLSHRQTDGVSAAEVESIFTPVAEEVVFDLKLKKPRRDDDQYDGDED